MSKPNRILLWLLGLLLVAALVAYGIWFFNNFESYTKEVKTGLSPEARKNHFLAAEYFLRQSDQDVESHAQRNIFELNPSADDTIFLGHHSSLFLERNNREILDWVKSGGNLVLVADAGLFEKDKGLLLVDELGVELKHEKAAPPACDDAADNTCDNKPEQEITTKTSPSHDSTGTDEEDERIKTTFRTDDTGEFIAAFLPGHYLNDSSGEATVAIGTEDGHDNLLRYTLGSGTVTFLSDTQLFSNNAIKDYDHAYLFYQLTHTPGKVWIFFSADMPSLLALMWKHIPALLLAGIAFLLMAGWSMLFRSGPRLTPKDEVRRNLLEHLNATAEYSWRTDKARKLFADNRHAIEQAWRRRHPQLNQLEPQGRSEWIGDKTGLSSGAVERTLYGDIATEQDFIRATAVLQRLATQVNYYSNTPEGGDKT